MKAQVTVQLHYPSAVDWMWNYCVYLHPYSYKGKYYDLGVYVDMQGIVSAAIVYGNKTGQYASGELTSRFPEHAVYRETWKRYQQLIREEK